MRWSVCSKSRRRRNLLLPLRIAIAAMVVIPIVYTMSAETTQTLSDGLPPPSPEEKAAHDETRVWTIGGIVAALLMALLTAWLAYAVWQKGGVANDLTLKRYEVAIAAAVKASRELEKEVATLQKAAADAKAAQQRVELELNEQRERTANAEAALLQLQEQTKDRHLTSEQRTKLVALLSAEPKGPLSVHSGSPGEPANFATELMSVLRNAGWQPTTAQPNLNISVGEIPVGIRVCVRDASKTPIRAVALTDSLKAVGIAAEICQSPEVPDVPPDQAESVRLEVGLKP